MTNTIRPAFELQTIMLALDQLMPSRRIPDGLKQTDSYKKIIASIRIVGVLANLFGSTPTRATSICSSMGTFAWRRCESWPSQKRFA
jgi:hypothetical protein